MAVMANQACMVFDFFCLFIAWNFETTIAPRKRERETFWYLFRLCTPYGSRVSLTGEEEEERKKEERK